MRDCVTCAKHNPQDFPTECRVCLRITEFGRLTLPYWKEKPVADTSDRKTYPMIDLDCTGLAEEIEKQQQQVKAFLEIDPTHTGMCRNPPPAPLLPTTAAERKRVPVASGVLDYFPAAIAAIAALSFQGNEQHNAGEPLHWARGKSNDHSDTMLRHFLERGTLDEDGHRHSAKMAWRALALLQLELEEAGYPKARGAR